MPWQATQEVGVPDAAPARRCTFPRVPMSRSVWEFLDTGSGISRESRSNLTAWIYFPFGN